jgi:hypothetical protein
VRFLGRPLCAAEIQAGIFKAMQVAAGIALPDKEVHIVLNLER